MNDKGVLPVANLHHQIEGPPCSKIRACKWVLGSLFNQWELIFTLDLTVAVILCVCFSSKNKLQNIPYTII